MEEQLKKTGKNVLDFWKKLSKKIKILIISLAVVILAGAIVLTIFMNRTNYVVLFSGLADDEVTEVMAKLKEKNVEYKYETNGQILVPEENENLVRMQLAEEGYPRSGLNYDLFTSNIDFMSTDFEKKQYVLYQLQERISASIKTISGVKDAIVNIAIPEKSNYAWDDTTEQASANVKINMKQGYSLSKSQVAGIQNLVATSVTGLDKNNVTIADNEGNELSIAGEENQTDILKLKLEIEKEIQNDIVKNVTKLLGKGYGEDNVEVSAKCSINLDKKISENLQYVPSDDKTNTGVVSGQNKDVEAVGEGTVNGGVVGTDNNAEVPTYPEVTIDGNNIYYKDKSSLDYLVSQVKEQIQHEPGSIEKLTVAVLVNEENLSDGEKNNIKELVAYASGADVAAVSLHNMKFATKAPTVFNDEGNIKQLSDREKLIIAIIAAGAIILLTLIIIIVKKIKKARRLKKEQELIDAANNENEENNRPDGETWDDLKDEIEVKETKEAVLKKQISDFSATNPDIAAQLIRTWLKGEEK